MTPESHAVPLIDAYRQIVMNSEMQVEFRAGYLERSDCQDFTFYPFPSKSRILIATPTKPEAARNLAKLSLLGAALSEREPRVARDWNILSLPHMNSYRTPPEAGRLGLIAVIGLDERIPPTFAQRILNPFAPWP